MSLINTIKINKNQDDILQIQKTYDYSKFEFFERNRNIDHSKYVMSIQKNDMLNSHPIICTPTTYGDKLYIVDGQNRFKSARQLGKPIFYIVDPDLTEEDISDCQCSTNWDIDSWLNFYKSHKNKTPTQQTIFYDFIDEIKNKYNMQTHVIVTLCASNTSSVFKSFRSGKYKISKDLDYLREKFEEFYEIIKEIEKISEKKLLLSGKRAVWSLLQFEDCDFNNLKEKIQKYPDHLIEAFRFHDYKNVLYKLVHDIYNRNNKDKKKNLEIPIDLLPKHILIINSYK